MEKKIKLQIHPSYLMIHKRKTLFLEEGLFRKSYMQCVAFFKKNRDRECSTSSLILLVLCSKIQGDPCGEHGVCQVLH